MNRFPAEKSDFYTHISLEIATGGFLYKKLLLKIS